MKIRIFNRTNAIKESYRELEKSKVIISISDPDKSFASFNRDNKSIKAKLYLSFYDIDGKTKDIFKHYEMMSKRDANKIVDFVCCRQDEIDEIWVNCEAGISRSAGIAAAITEHFSMDSSVIFDDMRYLPNMYCYRLTKNAFDRIDGCNAVEFENNHGKRGVFWVVDGELLPYPFDGRIPEAIAKSGNTYNHKLLWEHEKPKKKPFDYYPRGRVDINSRGEAVIYMNPNIGKEIIPKIKTAFGITTEPIIKYDRSERYKCYLDR